MNTLNLLRSFSLVAALMLTAAYGFAQQEQKTKTEDASKKVIIIKKSSDGTEEKIEKILPEGEGVHEWRFDDEDGKVIIEQVGEGIEKTIQVTVAPEDADVKLNQKVDVEMEVLNGEKRVRVRVVPTDGSEEKLIEWEGEGEIPVEIRQKLEVDGIFLHEGGKEKGTFIFKADDMGDDFQWTGEDDDLKIHTRHRIVVVTRGDKAKESSETPALPTETLPETDLPRSLQLKEYNLFPNPTSGNLRLRFAAESLPTTVRITDLNGKSLYRETLNQFNGRYDENIDLSDLPAGLLLLTIEQGDKVYTEQIVLR